MDEIPLHGGPAGRLARRARFNIDVKEAPAIAPLAEAIRRTAAYDRMCLTSFSDDRLAGARARDRPAGVLLARPARRGRAARRRRHLRVRPAAQPAWPAPGVPAPRCRSASAACGSPPAPSSARRTRSACRCTCGRSTTPDAWSDLLDLGVDGIMTDNIAGLRDVLEARGQWHPAGMAHRERVTRVRTAHPRGPRRPPHPPRANSAAGTSTTGRTPPSTPRSSRSSSART